MKNAPPGWGGRLWSTRLRRLLIAGFLALFLIFSVIVNVRQYPFFFAPVYFEWDATAGFERISVPPPGKEPHPLTRIYAGLIAWQARPWIAAEFRDWGWTSAKGHCTVMLLPFPPIVYGLHRLSHWEIIDPEVTPLMHAAERDNLRLVKLILASGADVNARDQRGWTPLMHACMTRLASAEIVEALLGAGADVNAKDRIGRTALIWALRTGGGKEVHEKVRLLLAGGADPNAKSQYGETPLLHATSARSLDTVAQLLAAGADPNAAAWKGESALAFARRVGDTEMVKLLKRAGARD